MKDVISEKPHTNLWEADDRVYPKYIRICLPRICGISWVTLLLIFLQLYRYKNSGFSGGISVTENFRYTKKKTKNLQHIKSLRLKIDCKQ